MQKKLFLFTCFFLSFESFSEKTKNSESSPWEFLFKEGTLSTYKETGKDYSYKAEGIIKQNFFDIVRVASHMEKRPEWVPNLLVSETIEGDITEKAYVYEKFHFPWPALDRDVVLLCQIKKDEKNKKVWVEFENSEHKDYPEIKGIVRVPTTKGKMFFEWVNEQTTHVIYEVEFDPGGILPDLITNMFIKKAPLDFLMGMGNQVEKKKAS